ncbi:serine hydrolase domain-containing protein [Robiginitalea biformata]|uniref:Putative non-ribosomal peptide synthetase n=1 Tax=Robiginitalea biformata (strain ATCC BAA-864 / DSM 15991 / KCTC 12146 / HTCC2501) TaxID=313596 RepID=A4CNQ2_ROBBH|nr:serine hydrolase domain-containing protein [Robiginitalea biformata]EAR14519.1 putative non-ribosomal peptide synthetase [Robiginitalea biformata HTCC2501]
MRYLYVLTILFFFISCASETGDDRAAEIHTVENGLLPGILVEGESIPRYSMEERMEKYNVPGAGIAVVSDGKLRWARAYGVANTQTGQPVDTATLFQAGSISKPIAALAALQLWEEGKVDLDADVNTYLKDWKVPQSAYTDSARVTLRLLLTHSAGMTVHGFPGYKQTDRFPDIVTVLEGRGNTDPIVVDTVPGSLWRYSGGGYTVMEKVVEDVSGMPLETYMDKNILPQLGMHHSTYQQPLGSPFTDNASAAYDRDGELIDGLWNNYPEQAAAGLWTTPSDLAAYCIAIQEILSGERNGPISQQTAQAMLTKHLGDWGLGPALQKEGDSLLFGHGGKNAGFTNNMLATAHQGRAVIVMTNADQGGNLMGEAIRAVSDYYGWGFSKPRTVQLIEMAADSLAVLAGNYVLDFPVPGIGEYRIFVEPRDGNLFVKDPNNGEENLLSPMDSLKFVDVEKGENVRFSVVGDTLEMTWNGRYRFLRMGQHP